MKTIYSFLTISALAVCLTACNDDISTGGVPTEESNSVYLRFALDLPSGSRSQTTSGEDDDYVTSEDGTEVGKDRENRINQIMLVFTDTDNTYLTSTNVTSVSPSANNEYVITIPPERLQEYVSPEAEAGAEGTGSTEQRLANVYVYCNPTDELRALVGASAGSAQVENLINKAHTITDSKNASVWRDNNFLMSNADTKNQITLPTSWNEHLSSSKPFNIGTLKVERSVARFDYKAIHENNIYRVRESLDADSDDDTDNPGIYIQLTDIALINMSKSFYYLRRVSDNGLNTNATVCGVETKTNYVVDTDAEQKLNYTTAEAWSAKNANFFYNLEEPNTWQWTSLADINENEEDNWGSEPDEEEGYHIWRYAIENTIPQDANGKDELQKNGITTGVVFRAKIGHDENYSGNATWTAGEPIYVFKDILYGDWEAVGKYAKAHSTEEVAYAYQAVESNDYTKEEAGFTEYKQNADGNYYAYYYYWNRHNDNNQNGIGGTNPVMGPMEFAVVRNNVYKLSVDAIFRFGYPEGETPDPEKPDEEKPKPEEDPDPEPDPKVFLKVNVEVLPWVVRVNEIEFGNGDSGTN